MSNEVDLSSGNLLQGKVAVVTGGAGGIGDSVCTMFAGHGADIVVADIHEDRLRETAEKARAHGREVEAILVDLTTREGMDTLTRRALERFSHVDILANGLGHHLGAAGPFESTTEEQWQALYEVNLLQVFRACQAFIPSMKSRGWGRIINFSSVEGVRAMPYAAVYTAFKGALNSFTRSLGVDLARYGILVNALAVDKTRSYQVAYDQLPEEYFKLAHYWIPVGHYGDPEDVAKIALFLASDLSSWMTGQVLAADGGTLEAGGWFRTPTRWTNQPLLVQYFEDDPNINEKRPPTLQ